MAKKTPKKVEEVEESTRRLLKTRTTGRSERSRKDSPHLAEKKVQVSGFKGRIERSRRSEFAISCGRKTCQKSRTF